MEYLIFVFLVTQYDVKKHFLDEDMYVTAKGIKRVLKTAVPRVAIEPDNGDDTEVGPTMFVLDNNKEFKSPTTSLSIGSILDTLGKVTIKANCTNEG
ncbi:unnamed protein product [Arctia plantaginis]|uniref:Uncharacterized protein n=1 Tax=Arctia plantaginis TaxID=874455 RepID=A0A8S0YZN7_ARCPL|nr:unnamed protein product [Arctia plantaginis]